MTEAEKILASLEVHEHDHPVTDTDVMFEINPFTRDITSASGQKTVIMQGDHNSERFTFKIPRYIEGHDMALCNMVQVCYINTEVEGRDPKYNTGVYLIDDFAMGPDDTMTGSWLISKNATMYEGVLQFMLIFSCISGRVVEYRWNSNAYDNVYVLHSLDGHLIFEDEYIDVIEQWKFLVRAEFTEYIDLKTEEHAAVARSRLSDELQTSVENKFVPMQQLLEAFNDILEREITNMDDALEVLQARMDTFSAMPEGSTTNDAELADVRTGADGTIYANAGEAIRTQITALDNKIELLPVEPVFDKYVARIIGPGYLSKSVEPFATSNEIVIPVWAHTIILDGMVGNSHVPQCMFISEEECRFAASDGATVNNWVYTTPANDTELNDLVLARMVVDIPENAAAFLVSNNTDRSGKTHPFNMYYVRDDYMDYVARLHANLDELEYQMAAISSTLNRNIVVNLPKNYSLVAGDTFELFYKGIVRAVDPMRYDIRITCDRGNAYRRKYVWTPSEEDIGEHQMIVDIFNDSGICVGSGTTVLNVLPKLTEVKTTKVLCIGDSLTAGGEWVAEVHKRLSDEGINNIEFVGRKGTDGAKYEATGGWFYTNYLKTDTTNPFFNPESGEIDFENYMFTHGNGLMDVCVILLGWNGTTFAEDAYKARVKSLIDLIRADYPNVKILLFGVQVPSQDGLGENYGCSWKYMDMVDFVFNLDNWHKDISSVYANVRPVNVAGQFDTEYNVISAERDVNVRNATKETIGINGVHPALPGYYQIADVAYRELTSLLRRVDE